MTMGIGRRRDARPGVQPRRQARPRSWSPTCTRTSEGGIQVPAIMLTMMEKQLVGSLFGSGNIRKDIPQLFELYLQGQLNLDDLVTQTYTLDEINEGYEAMRNGENIRGVIMFD